VRSVIKVEPYNLDELENYDQTRNFPALNGTSKLGPHLRMGTLSIREVISKTKSNEIFLSELIWREFFMQILYHFPHVVSNNFKRKYDRIQWRNNQEEFEKWQNGKTGYPIVDAGMRELNATGYMHNRVRMVVAGFLCKHLLIDWKWGEAYFATKLLDYELSSNNGNWQWSAGTGCDAAPYFRVFNPTAQVKKFDSQLSYINKWIPELDSLTYPSTIVDHKLARERAISTYKKGLE
jgi:deoxyribodipyrimidine photo-lyase